LRGSWLVLIGSVQFNFGVIWYFVLSFSYLVDKVNAVVISHSRTQFYS